jgi:hypothetical protein
MRRPSMTTEPLIAYVSGDTPPEFAAIAACGFDVVCVDSRAAWYNESVAGKAREHGLLVVAFSMGYVAPQGSTYRIAGARYGSPNGNNG